MFRGSDVKDISVAEEKENTQPEPPQVPDDPAILGVSAFTFSILIFVALSSHSVCTPAAVGQLII